MKKIGGQNWGFTLIELLVVMAIIGLLTAIIIPSISGAKKAAMRGRALKEMTELDGAAKRFFAEYGRMPMTKGKKFTAGIADLSASGMPDQHEIVLVLMNEDDWGADKQNKREIAFLELDPASFGVKTRLEMLSELRRDGYKDPWGTRYGFLLDWDLDDKIVAPPYSTAALPIRAKVGIFSYGVTGDTSVSDPPLKTW